MITLSDSLSTIDLGDIYAILPNDNVTLERYKSEGIDIRTVPDNFTYDSGTNPMFLTVEKLRDLIRKHVDSTFQPV